MENFAEGFRFEAFQNTAGARIEAEREWTLGKLAENPLLYRKIVFSDESHFWLNGYVNKQNCSEDQPKALQMLSMHPQKLAAYIENKLKVTLAKAISAETKVWEAIPMYVEIWWLDALQMSSCYRQQWFCNKILMFFFF